MLEMTIPGRGKVTLNNIVLDLNGTLTVDGELAEDTVSLLNKISDFLNVYILTADTLGSAAKLKGRLKAEVRVLNGEDVGLAKAETIERLGAENSLAVGNGDNDVAMLKKAAIAVAVLEEEGCSMKALQSADLLVKSIDDALMLVLKPQRLVAGLRS